MTVDRIVTTVRLGFSVLFLWMVIDGPWVKLKGESFGVFDAHGGSGFGIVAVAMGALILLISLLFLTGKEFEFRYFQIGRHNPNHHHLWPQLSSHHLFFSNPSNDNN